MDLKKGFGRGKPARRLERKEGSVRVPTAQETDRPGLGRGGPWPWRQQEGKEGGRLERYGLARAPQRGAPRRSRAVGSSKGRHGARTITSSRYPNERPTRVNAVLLINSQFRL